MDPTFDLDAALDALRGVGALLICPHDDPDPDALAAGWAMGALLERELGCATTLAFEGIIGRAENRAMVRELGIRMRRLERLEPAAFEGVVLVDTQPAAANHSAPASLPVLACVDHHEALASEPRPPWLDVRPGGGATSSIVYGYLRARGIEPDAALATAILYAVKTDTRDLSREATEQDLATWNEVLPRADLRALGTIVAPPLDPRYYHALHRALEHARAHGSAVQVFLRDLPYPDLVAELADLLVRRRGTDWCLCGGWFDGHLRFSLRTEIEHAHAGVVARRLVVPHGGSAGGHGQTAGGRIPLDGTDDPARHDVLWGRLVADFLRMTASSVGEDGAPICPAL